MSRAENHPDPPLHEQLCEARDTLRRQIEILDPSNSVRSGEWFGPALYDRQRADELRATLAEIEQQLAEIEADDA